MRKLAVALLVVFFAPGTANAFPTWKAYHKEHRIQVRSVEWEVQWTRPLWESRMRNKVAKSYHKWKDQYESYLASLAPSTSILYPSSGSLVKYNGDHLDLWLCIHSHEGPWTDPNPPYFGGLQMGYSFMEAYGGSLYAEKGTADHWTSDEQIGVAEAAWAKNGYYSGWLHSQWPVSSVMCGA
jgi:hypothetical protein